MGEQLKKGTFMDSLPVRRNLYRGLILLFILSFLSVAGCTPATPGVTTPTPRPLPSLTPQPEAMVTFRVEIPEPLPPGSSMALAVLDEVTGLALNQVSYTMEAEDATHYIAILPFPLNSVQKYRYIRQDSILAQEHLSDGRPVRYRLYHVDGPGFVQDVVSRWTDTAYHLGTGRISGKALDGQTGDPLPNLMVTAGGVQVFTDSSGSFLLEGLPAGTHNLVAYALDGAYYTYQQGAMVARDAATPAILNLRAAPMVQVTFTVQTPPGTIKDVPLRLAGNLYQLGNTFADLAGGVSVVASRMPQLASEGNGRFSISLELPVGADIRYKYTLGDGLWNSEQTAGGTFRLRQLLVPPGGAAIQEQIDSWASGRSAPITFELEVPSITPQEDTISIQFNPGFGWTEAIPMWHLGGSRWVYVLYNPLDPLGSIRYRYCRNNLCGTADDRRTSGPQGSGRAVSSALLPETIDDQVKDWVWLEKLDGPVTLPNIEIHARQAGFIYGVEFQPLYHPSWQPRMEVALNDLRAMNSGWTLMTPTWTFTQQTPPILELIPGHDPLVPDLLDTIENIKQHNQLLVLFPTPRFPVPESEWWQEAERDFSFWVGWYESYRVFLLHHAQIAAQTGAEGLVVGGSWLAPSLPAGTLSDGSPAYPPEDAAERWRDILREIRTVYKGRLLWALPHPEGLENLPPFLNLVDEVYLLWSAPLGSPASGDAALAAEAGRLLDQVGVTLHEEAGKNVVLGISYPSAPGWLAGCTAVRPGECINLDALARPNPEISGLSPSFEDQVRAYNAVLAAVNEREWISGFVSRGYYPPAVLHDLSASIHGKPARGVLWYWFPRLVVE